MELINILLRFSILFLFEIFLLIVFNFLSGRIKNPVMKIIDENEVPPPIKNFLYNSERKIKKLGFCFSHFIYIEGFQFNPNSNNWGVVLLNKKRSSFATVWIADYPDKYNPYLIEFITYFKDNRSLLTVNDMKHLVIGNFPNILLNDPYAVTIEQQWYSHLNSFNEIKNTVEPIIPNVEVLVCYENITNRKYIEYLLMENKIVECGEELYRLTLFSAIVQSIKFLAGIRKHLLLCNYRKKLPSDNIEIPADIIFERYLNDRSIDIKGNKSFIKDKLRYLIYILLFLAACSLFPLSYLLPGVLMIIIFEAGRFMNYVLFGNKNRRILL